MFSSLRLAVTTLVSVLFVSSVVSLPLAPRDQLCNGHSELCSRKYGNVTFLGAHDSFAVSGNPLALARTQEVDVNTQLLSGVRALQLQGHRNGDDIHFCHTSCMLFDGGKAADYLHQVKLFLDSHPNEVLTLIIANPEVIPVKEWATLFNSTGLGEIAYNPPQPIMTREDWPTLGEMISSSKRVVIFIDKGAEVRTDEASQFVLPHFQMMWEDKYDPTDPKFPCKVDRSAGPLAPNQQLNLINHNLNTNIFPIGAGVLIPDRLDSPRTNSVQDIEMHSDHCAPLANYQRPNFVLLDFVTTGSGSAAVDALNGFA